MKTIIAIFMLTLCVSSYGQKDDRVRVATKIANINKEVDEQSEKNLKEKISKLDLSRVPKKYRKVFEDLKNINNISEKDLAKNKKLYHQFLKRMKNRVSKKEKTDPRVIKTTEAKINKLKVKPKANKLGKKLARSKSTRKNKQNRISSRSGEKNISTKNYKSKTTKKKASISLASGNLASSMSSKESKYGKGKIRGIYQHFQRKKYNQTIFGKHSKIYQNEIFKDLFGNKL